MLRKVLKSIAGISVMLLLAGIFCMVPTFSKELLNQKSQSVISVDSDLSNADNVSTDSIFNANSSSISSITGSWQNAIQNADTSVSLSKVTYNNQTVNGYTFYDLENVYEISSAEQLALLAYYVNSGNTTYNSTTAVYILTSNIDLGSKLWTPIGTATNPFKASFIGVGYTISNVRVNDLTVVSGTNNGAGLFGNVSGNISDLVLGGTYSIDTTTEAHTSKGYLVGNLTGQVINCYTNGLSASSLTPVGSGGTIYKGATLDGKTATATSYTAIKGTGSMHSYYLNNGSFYIANSSGQQNWYNGDVYRMISSGTTNNPIYTNAVPVLRENASEGQVYPLYVGYQATNLPTGVPTSSGTTGEFVEPKESFVSYTLNYGYEYSENYLGLKRENISVSIPYDMTFADFFNSNDGEQYGERLGYTFKSLSFNTTQATVDLSYNDNNKYSSNNIYDKSYPVHIHNSTSSATFTWTAQTGKNIKLQFVTGVNSDGGSDTADFTNLPDNLIVSNISNLKNYLENQEEEIELTNYSFDSNYSVTLQNIISGSVTFNITIRDGYSLQIDGNDSSVAFSSIDSEGNELIDPTGTHPYYQTSGSQQDSYNLITGSHSYTLDDDGNKVYTITIDNIVGQGGTLNIRVVRDSIETELQIQMQKIENTYATYPTSLTASYNIAGLNEKFSETIENKGKGLYVMPFSYKLGQVISVNVSFTEENSWILSAEASVGLSSTKPDPGNIVDYEGVTFNNKYAKQITFTTESIEDTNPSYFKIVIGNAQTAVTIQYYDNKGIQIENKDNKYSDIQTSINSSKYNSNELVDGVTVPGDVSTGSFALVNMSNGNTGDVDIFYVRTNGKYDLDRIVIVDALTGDPYNDLTSKELFQDSNFSYTISSNQRYLLNAYANEGVNYIVKIYLKEREHSFDDAKVTFRADGSDLYSDLGLSSANFSDLFKLSISNTTNSSYNGFDYKNGDEISLTITLTDKARRIFYIDTNNFIDIDESAYDVYTGGGDQSNNEGYQLASRPNVQDNGEGVYTITFTAGTFDFDFIFDLTYKTIKGSVLGAKDSDKNDVNDSRIEENPRNFELKYSYNTADNTYSLTAVNDFPNISIFQKYYLLGWYLVNGEVVLEDNTNLSEILGSQGGTLNSYYTSAEGLDFVFRNTLDNKARFTFNLYAVVGERTIQVEYDQGDILNGEINETDATDNSHKTGDSFIYNQDYSILDQVFLNLGNNARGYTLTLLDANGAILAGFSLPDSQKTEISLDTILNYSVLDWWKIWVDGAGNYSNGLQAWAGLFNNSVDNTDKDNDSIRIIKVTYLWKPIQYKLQIDGQGVSESTYITIGSEITAEDDGSRTGTADYQILVKDLSNVTLNRTGGTIPGYTAVSFNIYQQSQDTFSNWQFESENGYTLSIEEFKKLIAEAYWYENSDSCVINISTQRVGARFKVYIQSSANDYYQLAWNEEKYPLVENDDGSRTNEYGGIEADGKIFIYVTYGSTSVSGENAITQGDIDWTIDAPKYSLANVLPKNIVKFINFTRSGYIVNVDYDSFNIDGGQNNYYTINSANPNFVKIEAGAQYSYTTDQTVTIRWTFDETTVIAQVEKADDVQNVSTLALLNSHELTKNATITDAKDNISTDSEIIKKTIENGDTVTDYGFNVYILQDGSYEKYSSFNSIYQFNLNLFNKAGQYQVRLYVTLSDYYGTTSYTVESDPLSFTVQQNYFVFTENDANGIVGNHIVSAYSNTNQFWATTAEEGYDDLNKFGQVYFALNWDSSAVTESSAQRFNFTDFFLSNNTDLSISGDYSVGDARNLKVTINSNTFNSVNSINGYAVSATTNWADLVANVLAEGSVYTHVANGLVNIVKARFTIDFGQSSSFYFDGVETVVYMSDNSFTFSVGKVNFSYKLDRIIYVDQTETEGIFTGEGDERSKFEVKGLKITVDGQEIDYDGNAEDSFYYLLTGEFSLTSPDDAIKKNYQTAYITSNSTGTLLDTLQTIYGGQIENLTLVSVRVGERTISTSDLLTGSFEGEFGTYSANNDVLFSFVGNHTPNLTIYFNQAIISANNVSYIVRVDIATSRSSHLSMLAFHDSNYVNDYLGYFDTTYQSNSFDLKQEVSGGDTNLQTTYAVLSDVRKVTVDYNGGTLSNQDTQEFYISNNGGDFILQTPSFDYQGMSFNGYSYAGADPELSGSIQDGFKLNVTKGGNNVTLVTKWKLNEVSGEQIEDTFDFYTSLTAEEITLSEILDLQALPQGTFSYQFRKNDASVTFEYLDGAFVICDSRRWLSSKLDGEYTLTVTIEYSDGTSGGNYIISKPFNVKLNVTKNAVGIENTSGDLTFNNADQKTAVAINILGNNDSVTASITLANLLANATTTADTYGIDVVLEYRETDKDQYSVSQVIRNAGQYRVTISINSRYNDIYNLNNDKSIIYIVVNEYDLDINLEEYVKQVNFAKYFGEKDPALKVDITVATLNNDIVNITFVRKDGEAIGEYPYTKATITNADDERDYKLEFDAKTFTARFNILTPLVDLQVDMDGTFNYIYNGQILGNIQTVYEDDTFKVVGYAGTLRVEQTFELYYLGLTGQKIYIPEVERVTYAGYINFLSDTDLTKNAGSYSFNVALSSSGQADNWNGVVFSSESLSNTYNKIVVNQRTIYIDGGSMVFNEENSFVYTIGATDNHANLTIRQTATNSGPISSDTITISGSFLTADVGTYDVTLTLDEESEKNYDLSPAVLSGFSVTPSQVNVSLEFDEINIDYGSINQGKTLEQILRDNIPVAFVLDDGSEIGANFITINSHEIRLEDAIITDDSYSGGGYLKSDTYTFRFYVSSKNFSLGQASAVDGLYSRYFDITVTVDKIEITISNSGNIITKEYDHNVNVLGKFVNQNVNQAQGFYITSTGSILTGDTISVVSAEYEDKEIGSGKKIVNVVYGNDYANYEIDDSGLKGDITSVAITFKKNLNTETFKEDGQDFINAGDFTVTYTGDMSDFISALISNYASRRGYDQIAWIYDDVTITALQENVPTDETSFDKFIGQAIAGNSTGGITLDAEWQIQSYTVTIVNDAHTQVNSSIVNPVEYYSSFTGDDKITFTIDEGYILDSIVLSAENAVISNLTGENSRENNSFEIEKIIGDVTITIVTREIQVRIRINTNEPEGFASQFVNNSDWANANSQWALKELVLSYSDLLDKDLPVVQITQEHTYDFLNWTLNNLVSSGNSIWERIGGDNFVEDNIETGFTFIANWTEAPLTITINGIEQAKSIKVTKIDGESENEIIIQDGVYNIHYNDQIRIDIVANDWWKLSSYTQNSSFIQAGGQTTTSININALESLVYDLNIELINITFTPTYQTPIGSSVTNAGSILPKIYTFTLLQGLNIQDIGAYTLTAGTYDHDNWLYTFEGSQKTLYFTKDIEDFILENGGIPTQDRQYTLSAHFSGQEYTITFLAGRGTFADGATTVKTYNYGDILSDTPEVIAPTGEHLASWFVGANNNNLYTDDYFTLTSPNPNGDYTLTLTAQFDTNIYTVNIVYSTDHVTKVTVNGVEYSNGSVVLSDVVHGQSRNIVFEFATGYTFDSYTLGDESQSGLAEITLNSDSSTLALRNVTGNLTINVTVKAKEYTITFDKSSFESITADSQEITEFKVSYDQAVEPILNSISFDRDGYNESYIIESESGSIFASISGDSWTFNGSSFVQDGVYKTDSDLTIKVVWSATGKYLSGTTTSVDGKYFNASAQVLAKSEWTSENDETTFSLNSILANGDQVVRMYYTVGNIIYESDGFNLLLTNAVTNAKATMSIELLDTLSPKGTTYTITSVEDYVTLNRSTIQITGANIVSYYTGEATLQQASDSFSTGVLSYQDEDGTLVTELVLARVEIVDASGLYNIGENYQVRYLFNRNSSSFSLSNYNGLTEQNGYIVFTPSTDVVSADIVKTPFTISISGKGFETGLTHSVQVTGWSLPSFIPSNFVASVSSITTIGTSAGTYTDPTDELNIDYSISRIGVDKKSNFEVVIDGQYQIVSADDGFTINVSPKYLDLTDKGNPQIVTSATGFNQNSYIISVTGFVHGSTSLDLTENSYNYITSDGTLIFTLFNNNSSSPSIIVADGQFVQFSFAISNGMSVLRWTDDQYSASEAKTYLDALTEESARTYQESFNSSKNVVVLLTDFKAIRFSLGDKGGQQDTEYMKAGQSRTYNLLPANEWTGFVANGWMSANSQVTTSGFSVTVSNSANITAVTLTMEWELANIIISEYNQSITRSAKASLDASIDEIIYNQIITKIGNSNSDITYTYVFSRDGQNLTSNNAPLLVPANTQSAGQYTLTVTAGYKNYVTKSTSVNFTLNITRLTLDTNAIEFNETRASYANYDYAQSISVTIGSYGTFTLDKLINASETSSFYFEMDGNEIRNNGSYTLTLRVNDTIFEDIDDFSQEIVISKATVTITQGYLASINLDHKTFGAVDPNFTFNYQVDFETTSTSETIEITLSRQAGEARGSYPFQSATPSSDNFVIEMEEGLAFTIEQTDSTLLVSFDNLTREYNSQNATFTITYDEEESVWTISSDNNGTQSNISLSIRAEDGTISALNQELYRLALNGITIGAQNAEDVNSYTVFTTSVSGDANFKQENIEVSGSLTITPKALVIASVTKTFDRSATFSNTVTQFANLETGDNITLSGNFAQVTVGTNIALSNLELSGSDAGNYTIANADTIRGSIVPLNVTQASMTLNQNIFTYGTLYKDLTITQLLSLSNSATVVVTSGVNDDLQNGYLSVDSWQVDKANLSSGDYINVGSISLTFTISSNNFSFNGNSTIQVTANVTINEKELDLSKLVIVKNYDGDTDMPSSLDTSVASFGLMSGDDVSIDRENSYYTSKDPNPRIPVVIMLIGKDANNYAYPSAYGEILEYSITFMVDTSSQTSGDFVTDGGFVNDGESIVVDNPYFSFEMSYIETISDGNLIMNRLIYPTRTGYSVTGWKYQADDGTFYDLSASNVLTLISQVDQDENNEEKLIYIYPVWSINYYSVTVNGNNIDSSTITSEFTQENKIKYFTDFTIDLVADLGFKITSYNITNGSVVNSDFSDVNKRNSRVAITGLGSDLVLEALTAEIQVTIEIDTNLSGLLNAKRTDSNNTRFTYSYSQLDSIFLEDLPVLTVTDGTYTLSGYNYGDDVAISDQSLQDIVLALDNKLNTDTPITLTAQWSGVNYKITLNANGGEFADGMDTTQIDVVYGEELPAIPTATKTGQTPVWTAPDDQTYESGEIFASIGAKASDEDYYTLTLTAMWQNASFTLTVNIDSASADRVSLLLGGANVASGSQFTLVYDETALTFTLDLAQGYGYEIDDSDFHGKFDGMLTSDIWSSRTFTISNLFADSTITLQAIPAQNSLTLSAENVASVSVQIDKGEASVFDNLTSAFNQSFTVYTESEVTITLTAKKGYLFTAENITLAGYAGVGEIEKIIAPDQKSVTIVWRNFTTSANISANATAGLNTITIPDLSGILVSLTINGRSVAVTGGEVQVYTDSVVTINAIFKYGYEGIVDELGEFISLSVQNQSNIAIIDAQTVKFNTSSRNYVLSATLGGLEDGKIDEAFSIDVQGKARVYNFALSVNPGQESMGSIEADLTQSVTFGSTLNLSSSPASAEKFILAGWEIGETIISYQDTSLVIDESLKDALETVLPNGTINVYAVFTNLSTSVTFASGAYGGYTVTQDQISASINGGATPTEFGLEYAKDIVLNVSAGLGDSGGYEIDQIIVDDITYSVNLLDSSVVFSVQGEQEESQTILYDTQTVLSIGGRNLTLTISLPDASNKANVTITIPFDVDNRFSNFTINYKASSILVKVTAGVLFDGILANYGTGDGGKIYLADEDGEKLGDEYYLDANGQILNGENLENLKGVDYYIRSYTDATIYFVLEANSGFSESFGGNNGSSYNVTVDGQTLYGFTDIRAGAEVFATFSAKSNTVVVNYIYQNEAGVSTIVNAGGFALANSSGSISITSSSSGNSSNSIVMQALTGANFELRLDTNLVYNFASHGGILRYSIEGEYDEEYTGVINYINDMTLGFTYETTFGIRNVQSDLTINIFVEPKVFNLVLNVVDGNTYSLENAITYGEVVDLSSIAEGDRALVLTPTRDGYTYGGYFTQEVGFGNQYIDRTGNAINNWAETGYTFSNSQNAYIPNANFDPTTQTFTLYAYWIYNQAFITVEFQPNSMNSYVTDANIQDIVTNQTLLIDATNRWYAAVTAGTQLNFSALSIDGYKFINWTIYQDEQSLGTRDAQFSLTTIQASYRIVALYQPTYSISSTKGGSASFVQNGSVLTGGSYDQTQDLILQATAEAGYQFLRFVDLDTGEEYLGTFNADTGTYTYDFGLIDRPLNIQAVFEGRSVAVTIDPTSALTIHRNLKIFLDGEEMTDYSFTATVDQTLSIEIDKALGYDIELIGAQFETQNLGYNRYRYNYILGMDYVTEQDGQLVLNIAMNAVRQEIEFVISFSVQDLVDQDELILAGNMTFTMPNGQNADLNYQDTVTMLYGESGTLNINILENYALSSILFNDNLLESDITQNFADGALAINPNLYSLNYSETYYITITLTRKLWTDEGVRSESLLGSGTEDDPYIIASASDFGLMAYLINSGAVNENDVSYAECHYKLTSNIDFEGNYWSPIGDSVEHAFKGSIDLGGYSITNLLLYRTYTNPSTSYGGLFWHIDGAKISQDNSTLIITLSIIGGILLLIAIIVLIILLIRRKKKKELEDIASGTN